MTVCCSVDPKHPQTNFSSLCQNGQFKQHRQFCHDFSFLGSFPQFSKKIAGAEIVFTLENKGVGRNFGKKSEKIPKMLQMLRSQNPSLVKFAAAAKLRLFGKPFESEKTAILIGFADA